MVNATRKMPIRQSSRQKTGDSSETVLESVGETFPPRKYDFIDLNDLPKDERNCGFCNRPFSTDGWFLSYPVRLPCSCIFCYGDCNAWLNVYRDCPECGAPFGDPALARESIELQIDQCRQHKLAQEQLSAIIERAAGLSLQHTQPGNVSPDTDPAKENVLAALEFLAVEPLRARAVQMEDLEAALSMMDLSDENTVTQLPGILKTISSFQRP